MEKRKYLGKTSIITMAAVILLSAVFFINSKGSVSARLSDAFFQSGLICVLLGLSCVVRNGGIFKSLSYFRYRSYKREMKKHKEKNIVPQEEEELDFAEFIVTRYSKKWNGKLYYIYGGALILLSLLCALLNNFI